MHISASLAIAILTLVSTVSCQVLQFTEPRQSPLLTRLNVQHQQQVPAFVITSIDQGWREHSRGADPKEQRVPVLIASNPAFTRSQYQYENAPESVPKPAASSPDYDVTEEEANDPRFRFLYDAMSKQYAAKYEATPAPSASPATVESATESTTSTTTTTTTEATTTTAAPTTSTTTQAPVSKEEILHTYPSYRSVASVPSHKGNYLQPAPRPLSAYDPVRAVKSTTASKYVPSDVFTIEQTTNYRPRYFHSDAIFYQKALAFLRDYKESVLNNREHGLTYRPNSETDDPTHVTNAYDELTPVIVRDREIPLVPRELLKPVTLAELSAKPQAVSYDEHPVAEDKQLVGFLPVIAMPKKNRYPSQPSYTLLSSLAGQESVPVAASVARKPVSAIASVPRKLPESKPSAGTFSTPSISVMKPQSYKLPEYEHTVPFLKVIQKH